MEVFGLSATLSFGQDFLLLITPQAFSTGELKSSNLEEKLAFLGLNFLAKFFPYPCISAEAALASAVFSKLGTTAGKFF